MKFKSLNKIVSFFILTIISLPINAEEEIDIWNKKNVENTESIIEGDKKTDTTLNSEIFNTKKINNNVKIEDELLDSSQDTKVFGLYEPANSDFNLNMWSQTSAENMRSTLSRIKTLKLSNTAQNLFEKTFFSFAYPPNGMKDEEFIDLRINWMIDNKRSDLIEEFLKQNKTFHNKKRVVQYLVDENIAEANLIDGCKKINFIDKNIKDSYLEKFKIYCLIFNDKKNEAQLLFDILKEQTQSDKFFEDKINFLLGITNKTSDKIREDNLLNFYLSSITIKDFKYEPKKNTKKIIWKYLNAANLIELEDIDDKEKLKDLENAANLNQFEKQKIFDIYKKIPFDLNTLINAENIYQTLEDSDSRALIYQKFLLSDNNENKLEFLFLLKDLFKKNNLDKKYPIIIQI